MKLIDQMVSSQPGLITQVTWDITHARFWSATIFLDHCYEYCYAHLMRRTSYEETLQAKEAYECLAATHGSSVCAYRDYNGRFT